MPRLWADTIDAHRHDVRHAVLEAVATTVADGGVRAVTMSRIAERAGIGRATLYKYFADVEALLLAWHEQQVGANVAQLQAVGGGRDASGRLEAVLEAYATMLRQRPASDGAAFQHGHAHLTEAEQHLRGFIGDLVREAARAGQVRDDVPAAELAAFCLHAVTAATALPSAAAARRLVAVTLAGLARP